MESARIRDSVEDSLDLTGDLIAFVRDVALWIETLDPAETLEPDLEEIGSRAHDLNRRIRKAMEL